MSIKAPFDNEHVGQTTNGDYRFGLQGVQPTLEIVIAAESAYKGPLQPPGSTEADIYANGGARSHVLSFTSDSTDGSGAKVKTLIGRFSQRAPNGSDSALVQVSSQTVTDKYGNLQRRDTKYAMPGAMIELACAAGQQYLEPVLRVQSSFDTQTANYTTTYDTVDCRQIKIVTGPNGSKVLIREEYFVKG